MQARLTIHYPAHDGDRIVMRTDVDWDRDVAPSAVSPDRRRHEFLLESERHLLRCRVGLHRQNELHWTIGDEYFVPLGTDVPFEGYPCFFGEDGGRVSNLAEIESRMGPPRRVRIYLPTGYGENELARYPVVYMQDGANLFLPEEAFMGQEWEVDETMDLLDRMRLIQRTIVVGVHAQDRSEEYTDAGYEDYGRSLRDEIKPWVDAQLRTLSGPRDTLVMGSSLGGVVSFFLGWEWPEVFGNVACLSSTFGYQNDLLDRVRADPVEPRRGLRIYLDSGWPKDNYEETLAMAVTLLGRGFRLGCDFVHCAFPLGEHKEQDWRGRLHLPIQFFAGRLQRLALELSRHPSVRE